ncbi:hypothetical protein AA12467_2157 [Gluconobacter sphaericus NBRC 12467]|nr:hypothetical protein AA12467_2157 [Gluconobacter sphaericus NBRC 12467]
MVEEKCLCFGKSLSQGGVDTVGKAFRCFLNKVIDQPGCQACRCYEEGNGATVRKIRGSDLYGATAIACFKKSDLGRLKKCPGRYDATADDLPQAPLGLAAFIRPASCGRSKKIQKRGIDV